MRNIRHYRHYYLCKHAFFFELITIGRAVFFEDIILILIIYSLQLVACGIAVATYNEGATDFKATPAYKESIQSRELLEEPEGSNSDVFELNPTEEAPSLE